MKRKKWNLADRFLIVIMLGCIAAVGVRVWNMRGQGGGADREFEVLAEWKGVDPRTAACLSAGETLYTASGERYGTVVKVESFPAAVQVIRDGATVSGFLPAEQRCDLRVTVRFEGMLENGTLLRGGTQPVAIGERFTLFSTFCELPLTILFC